MSVADEVAVVREQTFVEAYVNDNDCEAVVVVVVVAGAALPVEGKCSDEHHPVSGAEPACILVECLVSVQACAQPFHLGSVENSQSSLR